MYLTEINILQDFITNLLVLHYIFSAIVYVTLYKALYKA